MEPSQTGVVVMMLKSIFALATAATVATFALPISDANAARGHGFRGGVHAGWHGGWHRGWRGGVVRFGGFHRGFFPRRFGFGPYYAGYYGYGSCWRWVPGFY